VGIIGAQDHSSRVKTQASDRLYLGVHDVEDTYVPSGGIFDGFRLIRSPEPNSFLLVASGLLGLHWQARRRWARC